MSEVIKPRRDKRRNHEGTFRQLPSGRYEGAKWVKEVGRLVSVTADTEAKARRALNEKVALVQGGHLPARKARIHFLEYAERVIQERDGIGQRTRDKYEYELTRYAKALHAVPLGDIKPAHLRKVYAALRVQGLSDTVRIHTHVLIRMVLETARVDKHIASNPADEPGVRPRRERGSKAARGVKSFSPQESVRLLEFAPQVLHGEVAAFLLLTGMRRGEVMGLRWASVDLKRRTASVNVTRSISGSRVYEDSPKTDQSIRDVPLSTEALELLQHVRQLNQERRLALYPERPESDYVFPSLTGGPQRPDNVRRILHQIYDQIDATDGAQEEAQAKVEGRLPRPLPTFRRLPVHALRHTFVSVMAAAGARLEEIATWIGDNPTTVMVVYLEVFKRVTPMPSMGVGNFRPGVTSAPEGSGTPPPPVPENQDAS